MLKRFVSKTVISRPSDRSCRPSIDLLEGRMLFSTITVLNLNDHGSGSLRNAIAGAAANDVIGFSPALHGKIVLTTGDLPIGKSLAITGPGASKLTISGDNLSRVFEITKAGAVVKIQNLAIDDGHAADGAGIDNAGSLSVLHCTFTGNHAAGATGAEGRGGAIFNGSGGFLSVYQSGFFNNSAVGGYGANGGGGAIYNFSGNSVSTTLVNGSTFDGNHAAGGANGGFGLGGAIINFIDGTAPASPITVTWSSFYNNIAQGGTGGGFGVGGGIWTNSDFSTARVGNSLFIGNQAVGGDGGGFGIGGGIANGFGGAITVATTLLSGNLATGGFGGGNGIGGGIANINIGPDTQPTVAVITNPLLLGNRATGGSMGGDGQGGGLFNGLLPLGPLPPTLPILQLSVKGGSIGDNQAVGGSGAGNGQGGGVYAELASKSSLSQTIVLTNSALAGPGGTGVGGGLYVHNVPSNPAVFSLPGTLVIANDASTSNGDIFDRIV